LPAILSGYEGKIIMLTKNSASSSVQAKKQKRPFSFRRVLRNFAILLLESCLLIYLVVSIGGAEIFTKSANRQPSPITPTYYNLGFSNVSFPAADDNLTIRGWFVPAESERAIIVLHGKDGDRVSWLEPSVPLARNGFNLLLIDLRGHGASDGSNFSYGQYEQRDVIGAVNYLKGRGFKPEHIGVLGESMGAAVGLLAMARTPDIKAMVADSSYAELEPELEHAFPILTGGLLPNFFLPGMLLTASVLHGIDVNQVRPQEAVKQLNGRSLLLIHGAQDGLIPVENIYKLKAAAGANAETWVVPGANHVEAQKLQHAEYVRRTLAFFQREL